MDDREYLKTFFQNLTLRPIEPDHPFYVPIWERGDADDPVELLKNTIESAGPRSAQLLSGYRGAGKSTELRRLRRDLRQGGRFVVLCDMEDFLDTSAPIDICDFLLALAGAVSEQLVVEQVLQNRPDLESYWTRFRNFMARTEVKLDEVSAKLGADAEVELKASLKSDPSFRQKLQAHLALHLSAFLADVRGYIKDCVRQVHVQHGQDAELVILVDSMEHFRGVSSDALAVHDAVERLFAGHADKLCLPDVHLVYTVPPWLKICYPGVEGYYQPGGLVTLTAQRVTSKNADSQAPLADLERVLKRRAPDLDWQRLLGDERAVLDQLIGLSGGHLRDLFRLVAEVIRRCLGHELPATQERRERAISAVRSGFGEVAQDDAQWLATIARTRQVTLPSRTRLPDLARFFDTHLVLCYRNGREWYDVHPLIREQVEGLAASQVANNP